MVTRSWARHRASVVLRFHREAEALSQAKIRGAAQADFLAITWLLALVPRVVQMLSGVLLVMMDLLGQVAIKLLSDDD